MVYHRKEMVFDSMVEQRKLTIDAAISNRYYLKMDKKSTVLKVCNPAGMIPVATKNRELNIR